MEDHLAMSEQKTRWVRLLLCFLWTGHYPRYKQYREIGEREPPPGWMLMETTETWLKCGRCGFEWRRWL